MTGSSADGVDVCVCDFAQEDQLLLAKTIAYPNDLRSQLLSLINHVPTLDDLMNCQWRLTLFIEEILSEVLKKHDYIDAVGIHGHTVFHQPLRQKSSWQLLNSMYLAEQVKRPIISDFRSRDIALGGQGAPLAPLFHQRLFSSDSKHVTIVNIGGIANVTHLHPDRRVYGYDIGPGNCLMDLWIDEHKGRQFDLDGAWASTGSCHDELLANMLQDDFFKQSAPKSLHRDYFNQQWLSCFNIAHLPAMDVQATLMHLTAKLIAMDVAASDHLILVGGGAKNKALVELIALYCSHLTVEVSERSDYVEAHLIAWLAHEAMKGNKLDYTQITGAVSPTVYGEITYPSLENCKSQ